MSRPQFCVFVFGKAGQPFLGNDRRQAGCWVALYLGLAVLCKEAASPSLLSLTVIQGGCPSPVKL